MENNKVRSEKMAIKKIFKRGSKRLGKITINEGKKVGGLAKAKFKETIKEYKEERGVRKEAFKKARLSAIKSQASREGRASVKQRPIGISSIDDIIFGTEKKKKRRNDGLFPF